LGGLHVGRWISVEVDETLAVETRVRQLQQDLGVSSRVATIIAGMSLRQKARAIDFYRGEYFIVNGTLSEAAIDEIIGDLGVGIIHGRVNLHFYHYVR
jgi:hypothetical protein